METSITFKQSGSKLEIIAIDIYGECWLKTLKASSKRIKPGCERFVYAAFNKWKQEISPRALRELMAAESLEDANKRRQLDAQWQAMKNGEVIAKASQKWQDIFRDNPQWGLSAGVKNGPCSCELYSTNCDTAYYGSGNNWKEAKADAARSFLEVHGFYCC